MPANRVPRGIVFRDRLRPLCWWIEIEIPVSDVTQIFILSFLSEGLCSRTNSILASASSLHYRTSREDRLKNLSVELTLDE